MIAIRTSTPTLNWDLRVAEAIKREFDVKTIFFGPHVCIDPQSTINHSAVNAVAIGEPELILTGIAESGFQRTRGVWYQEGYGIKREGG
jgi:hypothetical protein